MSANLQEYIEYSDANIINLDDIFSLELDSYALPWTKGILRDCLNNHYDFIIAKYNNVIIGYIIAKISSHETHRVDNIAAINLYEKHGFRRISIRKNYYKTSTGREDAIVFKKIIS